MRTAVIGVALLLSGCAGGSVLMPQPSPQELSTAVGIQHVTAFDVGKALNHCKRAQVPHQAMWGDKRLVGHDMNEAWKLESHGLSVANGRISSANSCMDSVTRETGRGLK